jgi:hypothetical protein
LLSACFIPRREHGMEILIVGAGPIGALHGPVTASTWFIAFCFGILLGPHLQS